MTLLKYLFVCLFFFSVVLCQAQNEDDAGLWTGLGIGMDLGKGLKAKVSPQLRLDENMSRVAGLFSDFGIEKEINEYLDFGIEYRVGARRRKVFFEDRHRFSTGISAKVDIAKFRLGMNLSYQMSPRSSATDADVDTKDVVRYKTSIRYDAPKKWLFDTSFEIFADGEEAGLSDWRWQVSAEKELSKRKAIEVGYLIQKNLYDLDMDFVVQATYKYDLKSFSKKEKATTGPIEAE